MSHVPAVPEPAHVSRVPRTLLDRVAQWWRTSALTLWAVAGPALTQVFNDAIAKVTGAI